MDRKTEIHMILLALESYWKEHPEFSLDEIIYSIKNNLKTSKLEDRVAYYFLLKNIKDED